MFRGFMSFFFFSFCNGFLPRLKWRIGIRCSYTKRKGRKVHVEDYLKGDSGSLIRYQECKMSQHAVPHA